MLAVFVVTAFAFGLDRYILAPGAQTAVNGVPLTLLLGLLHLPLLGITVWGFAQETLAPVNKVLLITAAGLYFGQISNSNAHELIHRRNSWLRRLGVWSYASLLNGHHDSAHRLVHHVHAGTRKDPNTARLGEGFWRFVLRASRNEYRAGYSAEKRLRQGKPHWQHPYFLHGAISAAALAAAALLGGWVGVLGFVLIAVYAQLQLYLSDYVQHYGLLRQRMPDGSTEAMGPAHAWNAPHWYSSAMMLNAPRHSDHHMKPGKAFPELTITPKDMPMLPQSLPVMAVLALFPPLWRKVMDKRALRFRPNVKNDPERSGDIPHAIIVKVRGAGQPLGKLSGYRYEKPQNRNMPLPLRAPSLRPDERF